MSNNADFFTGDQNFSSEKTCCQLIGSHLSDGAKIISGEIVFEKMQGGVRVTARDSEHKTLWGFIASPKTLTQMYSSVGIYITLQKLLAEELGVKAQNDKINESIISTVHKEIARLKTILDDLNSSVDVKKTTDATLRRGKAICEVIKNVTRLIETELTSS